ncbi:21913_t:CDS:2, partial [Gigaspora rosea]
MLQEYNNKRRKQVTKRQKKDIVDVLGDDFTENDVWAEDIFAENIREDHRDEQAAIKSQHANN